MSSDGPCDITMKGHRISLTLLAFYAILLFALGVNITPASLGAMGADFAVDPKLLGSRFFFIEFACFFAAVLAGGYLADTCGKWTALLAGCLLSCTGFVFMAASSSAAVAGLGIGLVGAGGGIVESQGAALLCDIHRRQALGYLNLSQMFYGIGAVIGPFAAGTAIRQRLPWRLPYAAVALLFAVGLIWCATSRMSFPNRRAPDKSHRSPGLLRNAVLWAACLGMFLYVAAESAAFCWIPQYFTDRWSFRQDTAGLMLSLFWGGMILSRLLVALLHRRLRGVNLVIGCLLSGAVVQALFMTHTRMLAIACAPLLGFAFGAVWPTMLACAGHWFPGRTGPVFAMITASGSLAIVLVPPLIGLLAQAFPLGRLLAAMAVFSALNAVLFVALRRWETRRGLRSK